MRTYIADVSVFLEEDVIISSHMWTSPNGSECAVLTVGAQFQGGVTFHVDRVSPEALDRLAEVAAELASWRRQQIAAQGGEPS